MAFPLLAGLTAAPRFLALKKKVGTLLKSPWLYVILAMLAIGGGTYLYLKKSTETQITTAVKNADANATIKTFETKEKINEATAVVDEKFERRRVQTQKEYHNVRTTIIQAPSADRDAPASPVVIDTLNRLGRMRPDAEAANPSGTADAEVPVG